MDFYCNFVINGIWEIITESRSTLAATMENILEDNTGELFTLGDKAEDLANIINRLEKHIKCCDNKS